MKVAVIGSGISGLAAARALDQTHEVTLFEESDKLGGHSCTVDVDHYGVTIPVDCGFIVYNRKTYPQLTKLFQKLSVKSRATGMDFSVSLDDGGFEWAVGNLNSMFAQRRNAFDPRFYQMLRNIVRFFRVTNADLKNGTVGDVSLGEYLNHHGFSEYFSQRFLVPMCRSIWSSSVEEVFAYPAWVILNFLADHGLLSVKQPIWLTLAGGSRTYVEAIVKDLRATVRPGTKIVEVRRTSVGVLVTDANGASEAFDHAILACHAPQALEILASPTPQETKVLGAFGYARNTVVLHGDSGFMPASQRCWASWNYRGFLDGSHNKDPVILTYWMNKIQHIPQQYPLFVTLNPPRPPAAGLEFARFEFEHPQFDHAAIAAQKQLKHIQGNGNIWFCGAYGRYGFHEDGYCSGIAVAEGVAAADAIA